jgi:hypothetical protein
LPDSAPPRTNPTQASAALQKYFKTVCDRSVSFNTGWVVADRTLNRRSELRSNAKIGVGQVEKLIAAPVEQITAAKEYIGFVAA